MERIDKALMLLRGIKSENGKDYNSIIDEAIYFLDNNRDDISNKPEVLDSYFTLISLLDNSIREEGY